MDQLDDNFLGVLDEYIACIASQGQDELTGEPGLGAWRGLHPGGSTGPGGLGKGVAASHASAASHVNLRPGHPHQPTLGGRGPLAAFGPHDPTLATAAPGPAPFLKPGADTPRPTLHTHATSFDAQASFN